MGRNRSKTHSSYFGLPNAVLNHENYLRLSAKAVKLLIDLGEQYTGFNNGDLCATWSMMQKRGWKSRNTLYKALKELLHYGLIIKSRQGGKHAASLYALTWKQVDECKGKLDIKSTKSPPGYWKEEHADWVPNKTARKKSVTHIESRLTRIEC
jgi:DNA-binding PadR family transcriptional regulator